MDGLSDDRRVDSRDRRHGNDRRFHGERRTERQAHRTSVWLTIGRWANAALHGTLVIRRRNRSDRRTVRDRRVDYDRRIDEFRVELTPEEIAVLLGRE